MLLHAPGTVSVIFVYFLLARLFDDRSAALIVTCVLAASVISLLAPSAAGSRRTP